MVHDALSKLDENTTLVYLTVLAIAWYDGQYAHVCAAAASASVATVSGKTHACHAFAHTTLGRILPTAITFLNHRCYTVWHPCADC